MGGLRDNVGAPSLIDSPGTAGCPQAARRFFFAVPRSVHTLGTRTALNGGPLSYGKGVTKGLRFLDAEAQAPLTGRGAPGLFYTRRRSFSQAYEGRSLISRSSALTRIHRGRAVG